MSAAPALDILAFGEPMFEFNDTGRDRYSIAFFYSPNVRTVIECLPTCVSPEAPPRYPPAPPSTGYAPEPDWKHGMYQGDLVVQGVELDTEKDRDRFWGIVDAAAKFETNTGDVGYGLHEYMFLGDFPKYNLTGMLDGAP